MDPLAVRTVARVASTGLLLYSAYKVFTCPCDKLISCHLDTFLAAYIGAGAVLGLQNMFEAAK